MRRILTAGILVLASALSASAQVNTINTVAGGGTQQTKATSAYLPEPNSSVRDSLGNTYISVPGLNVVYKVDTSGNMTIYAGTGIGGFSGDGGAAASAQLSFPSGLAIDKNNNLYIADYFNNRIREVNGSTQIINTVAGSGDPFYGGYGGDGGAAKGARLNTPESVAVDANGNIFIADTGNALVREVTASTGVIETIAGGFGNAGCPGGAGSTAGFSYLYGIAVDSNDNVFVSDQSLEIVCKLTSSGTISTYAGTLNSPGTPGQANGDGGPATSAKLLLPSGLGVDADNNLYIADPGAPKIREVTGSSGVINSVAGIGLLCGSGGITPPEPACGDGGAPLSAAMDFPEGVFVDAQNNVVITDTYNMRVRVVTPGASSTISNFAGSGAGGDGGPGTSGILGLPQLVAVDSAEDAFIMNTNGERVQELSASTGDLSTVAGNGTGGATVTCVGASCSSGASNGDGGPATQGRFDYIAGFATDASGNLYFVDESAEVVRAVNMTSSTITIAGVTIAPGDIDTIAGNGATCEVNGSAIINDCGFSGSGQATSASFSRPSGVAADGAGNVFISDVGFSAVFIINNEGIISQFAGTPGTQCASYVTTQCGDDGPATAAQLSYPTGLAAYRPSTVTEVFIADGGDNVIREVDTDSGTISRVAFNGLPTFGGDDGLALEASMFGPSEIAVDNLGNMYIGGGNDNVVQRVDASDGTVVTVAGDVDNLDGGFSGDGGPSTQAMIANYGVAVFNTKTATHDIFIGDSGSNRVRRVNLAPVTIADPTSGATFTFGPSLAGSTTTTPQDIAFANNGLDDLILTVSESGSTAFVISGEPQQCAPTAAANVCTMTISPGNAGDIEVNFNPAAGASGTLTATIAITTNDAANPSFSYSLTGSVTAPLTLNLTNPSPDGTLEAFSSTSDTFLECPSTCTGTFPSGTAVTLLAVAETGFAFQSWNVANDPDASNCATVTLPECSFTIKTSGLTVGATFVASTTTTNYTITVAGYGNGSGTVTGGIAGGPQINCTITNGVAGTTGCSQTFNTTTSPNGVLLTETTSSGSTFDEWYSFSCFANPTATTCTASPDTETVYAIFSGPPVAFQQGQVFLDAGQFVFVLDPTSGDVVQVLNNMAVGEGITFDSVGKLYVAEPSGSLGVFSSDQAGGPTQFGSAGDSYAFDVVIDPSGTAIVAEDFITGDNQVTFLEFPQGSAATTPPSATYYPEFISDNTPPFWTELLDNGNLAYTLGSDTVKVFSPADQSQRPDIIPTPVLGLPLYALRELPDGTLLVAAGGDVIRMTQAGTITQTYSLGSENATEILAIDPSGTSFWVGSGVSGKVLQVNLSTGAIINNGGNGFSTPFTEFGIFGFAGIAVYGQPESGGADLSVTMTAPASVAQNSNVTFTATVVNNGPLAATNATLTDTLPAGATFVSANSTVGSCSGTTTVTCTIGTMNSAATATVTIVVTATQSGTLTNTVNVTSGVPDPNLTNNSATTNTTVTAGTPVSLHVSMAGTAEGTVTDNVGQINCQENGPGTESGTCSADYTVGEQVTFTASTPGAFSGFSGTPATCTGTGLTCQVTMTAASETVTATFAPGTSTFPLTVLAGTPHTGSGTITSSPAGINCTLAGTTTSGTCSAVFPAGEFVTLTSAAGSGSTFFGWTGTTPACITSSSVSCEVAVTAPETVEAEFTSGGATVSVTVTGAGNVEDKTNPTLINCTNTATGPQSGACSGGYGLGTAVTLTETPASGSTFASWSGGVCANPTSTTCTFTVTTATTYAITATFQTSSSGGLTFTSTTLTPGAVTIPYGADIPVTGGTPPYTFAVTSGSSLPTGFSMDATAAGTVAAGHVYNNAPMTAGTFTFGVTVTDSATPTPNTANASISLTIAVTPPNTQPGLLNGQYAFLARAFDESTGVEHSVVGSFTFDGKGNITAGEIDNNGPGTNGIYNAQVTGVYSIGPDNRGVMSVTPTGENPGIFTISVGNVVGGVASNAAVTLFLDNNANSQIGSGVMMKQDPTSFTQASFAGTYVFGLTGQGPAGSRAGELGFITFDNAGHVTAASDDININGTMSSSTFTGTYTGPDSNGRILQTNGSSTTPNDAIYLISANEGIAITLHARSTDGILVGTGFRQSTGTFSTSSLAGPDVLSVAGVSSSGSEAIVGLLTATAGASPTVSFTADTNDGGNVTLSQTQTGSYAVATNGRTTLNLTTPVLVYLEQQDRGFALSTDSSVSFGELELQTGGPFSASSVTGSYFLGQEEAVQTGVSAFSGVGTAAGTTMAFTADESHAGGNLYFDNNLGSTDFEVSADGHFTISQSSTTGGLTGYLVSPTEAIFFDTSGPTTDPAPSVHPLLDVAQSLIGTSSVTPVLSITKTHTGNFTLGQSGATYTVTVSNGANSGPTSGTVTVTDNLPTEIGVVSEMSGTGWTCETPSASVCIRSDALAAGASYPPITVTVTVSSTLPVTPQANSVTVSGGGSASATATDPTTILSPSTPVATLNPSNGSVLAFGTQAENVESNSKPVTLTNTGTAALTVTSISITAGNANFTANNNCPASLPVGTTASSTCTINVLFDPTALGPLTGTLTVKTNDPTNPTQTISLTGTGVPSGPAVATLNPAGGSTLAFGNQAVSVGSNPMTVTLTNTGGAALTVSGISINEEIKAFSETNNCPATLGVAYPAASCTVSVVFTPTSLTGFSGTLVVTTSDPKNPTQTISLSGTGVPGGAVTLSATTINFGDEVLTIKSGPQTVTLTNSGSGPLSISSIVSNGDYAQTNTCPVGTDTTPLPTNGTCTITVTFTPTQTGTRSGTVVLTDNATNSPQSIALTGTGTMVGLTPGPGSSTTVTVNPGGTGVFGLILVTPPGTTGTATLSCSSPDASITCLTVPSSVNLTGKTVETAVVVNSYCTGNTLPTGGPSDQLPFGRLPLYWLLALCALGMFTLASLPKAQRQRMRLAMAPALLAIVMMVNAACGNLPKSPTGAATPPGTYTLNITATLDNTSFTIPVTLIVK